MNKMIAGGLNISGLLITLAAPLAFAASAVSINYGVVESVQTVQQRGEHAGGAVAGGLLGAALAGPRHRLFKIGASAAAGAAIQGAATSGMTQQYRVALVEGGESMVTTEQQGIQVGDCVSVEQGDHANIRRVSRYHCEYGTVRGSAPEHHKSAADNCQIAKDELAKAQTDDDIDRAVKKARILCED